MEEARDRSVRWRWRAYSHNGDVAMESRASFETLTECMNDARREGYAR